jgi:hypothetical protein
MMTSAVDSPPGIGVPYYCCAGAGGGLPPDCNGSRIFAPGPRCGLRRSSRSLQRSSGGADQTYEAAVWYVFSSPRD